MNELHEKFEEYGEYVSKNEVSQENNDRWMDLNEWIHVTEIVCQLLLRCFLIILVCVQYILHILENH